MSSTKSLAIVRFLKVLGAAVVATVLAWLGTTGPVDIFGSQVAVLLVPVLAAVLSGLEKAFTATRAQS